MSQQCSQCGLAIQPEKKKTRIHNKAEGVHIHTVHTTTVVCEEGKVNRLSNHDDGGVENVPLTVHLVL